MKRDTFKANYSDLKLGLMNQPEEQKICVTESSMSGGAPEGFCSLLLFTKATHS